MILWGVLRHALYFISVVDKCKLMCYDRTTNVNQEGILWKN